MFSHCMFSHCNNQYLFWHKLALTNAAFIAQQLLAFGMSSIDEKVVCIAAILNEKIALFESAPSGFQRCLRAFRGFDSVRFGSGFWERSKRFLRSRWQQRLSVQRMRKA